MGEPRIKDNISSNRDVLSSISWAFDRVLQGLRDLDNPAKPLITRLGSIRDQAELSVVYALATRSASGVVPLLSTSHTKSCSSSGSDRASAFASSARVFLNRLALLAGTSAAVARACCQMAQPSSTSMHSTASASRRQRARQPHGSRRTCWRSCDCCTARIVLQRSDELSLHEAHSCRRSRISAVGSPAAASIVQVSHSRA
jgi:hypothetical protein